jgi:molybdopterin-guanine dinucleotide biosynthesis protein A
MTPAPLYGLVLAGGQSTRMQRDKAGLRYHGRSQLEHAVELLQQVTDQVYVSVRADQAGDPLRSNHPQIVDRQSDIGPAAGILAAFDAQPAAAWLVLACDLPFLELDTLRHLVANRDPTSVATAYRSRHDQLPEPLCAIYEPAAAALLTRQVTDGKNCPRKFLLQHAVQLLALPTPTALDNINTGAEYSAAMSALSGGNAKTQRFKIEYFAILREQAGCREENVVSPAVTPRELYDELQARHGFSLDASLLRVAINDEFGDWTHPLAEGDRIVFIPPVAGG